MRLYGVLLLAACKVTQVSTEEQRESVSFFPDVCERAGFTNAGDGDEGKWLSARITPTEWPFEVVDFGYSLSKTGTTAGGEDCAVVDHEVAIYKATTVQDDPNVHEIFEVVDVETPNIAAPHISHDLSTPLLLEEGEDAFVMLRATVARNGSRICYITCQDRGVNDRNYWSNRTEAPYDWVTLMSTGLDVDIGASIGGFRRP